MKRSGGHCQTKFYTASWRAGAGWSPTVFAQESLTCSARFDAENDLYSFALTVPAGESVASLERRDNAVQSSDRSVGALQRPRAGGRNFDTHPRAKVKGRAVRQQAMAIDLRRRSKQYVMVSNGNRNPLPTAHNFARARVDFAVERMDSVAEVRDESVEPLGQRVVRLQPEPARPMAAEKGNFPVTMTAATDRHDGVIERRR